MIQKFSLLSILIAFLLSLSACCTKMPSSAIPPPSINPNARAEAFKLFYRERAERTVLALNRFGLAGDTFFASAFGKNYIARAGNRFEAVPGPNDNNPIGMTVFGVWKGYQAIGGRDLELPLIRLFEGLAFNEAVSGHPGLTCREALPGWTVTLDGVNKTVTRMKAGSAVTPPVTCSTALEREILDRFYNGVVFTYRNDPGEYYFNFKAVNELEDFSTTFVFHGLPDFLRISDCCSSWMVTKTGPWKGAFWGNHNSRDNFPDYAMGYLAALEAAATPGLPADLAKAAGHAAAAARRTCDAIAAAGMPLMTVGEWSDYATLVPAGQRRPDGTTEAQYLGSLVSCQMAYLARAISSEGLTYPPPEISLPAAMTTCRSIDDAVMGVCWGDVLRIAEALENISPDLLKKATSGIRDDFKEILLSAAGLCYYARMTRQNALYDEARKTLWNLIRIARLMNEEDLTYHAALYARMFDMDAPMEDFKNFEIGDGRVRNIESRLASGDTSPSPLISNEQIRERVMTALEKRERWIRERYRNRFGDSVPVRRAGEGYECLGPDDRWMPTGNPRHLWFGDIQLWKEIPLCSLAPQTLDCSWARLGCAPADLNGSGSVDAADMAILDYLWNLFGPNAACFAGNGWCDGADLDRNGALDNDDRAFMAAAMGCIR
jgi:hypothetical protein